MDGLFSWRRVLATGAYASQTVGSTDEKKDVRRTLDLVRQLQDDFRERNEIHRAIDTVVYMQHEVKIPAAWEKFAIEAKSPLALKTVNTITAALSVNAPTTHFEPVRMGTAGDTNATQREHFFDAAWLRQEEEADRPLFRVWMHHLVTHGQAVLKTVEAANTQWGSYYSDSRKLAADLDKQGMSEADRRKKYESGTEELKLKQAYPLLTTVVPPSNFMYVETERGFSAAVEVKQVPYYEALTKFNAGIGPGGKVVPEAMALPVEDWDRAMHGRRALTLVEVWKWDRVECYLCDPGAGLNSAKRVDTRRHRYGNALTHTLRGPYFLADGITTSSGDHKYRGLSVIFGFLYLYPLYDALMTGMGEGAMQWSYPFLGGEAPSGRPPLQNVGITPLVDPTGNPLKSTLQVEPGMALPPGMHFIDPPRLGMDMKDFMGQVKTLLEMALPSVVQGVMSGDESGYALQTAAHLARLEWDPIVKNAERALSRRTGFESWLIENCIGERVYAWGDLPTEGYQQQQRAGYLSIHPDDLAGAHRYSTRLEPETPANRVIEIRTHSEMVDKRFETWEQAVEELGNSPSEVELGWLLYDVKNDPRARGKVLDQVFALLAVQEQQDRQAAGADLLGALGAPPAPGPGGPGVPPAPGQQAMQTTQDANQAGGPPVPGGPGGAPGGQLGGMGQVATAGQGLPIQPPPNTIPQRGLPGGP